MSGRPPGRTPASTPARTEPGVSSERWLLATLVAITTTTAIVSSLGAPLVPSIAEHYDVPISTAQWTLTATLIAAAAATPTIGRWGSGRLRRPVIIGALVTVLAGTLLAALPLDLGPLIAGRTLQGVGLAVTPLALAVSRRVWTGDRLAARLSLLSVATVAGAGVGYPLTGLVAQYVGVSGAFGFGSLLVTCTLVLALWHLPRDASGDPQPVDLPSVGLVVIGLAGTLLAISQGESWGWLSPGVLACAGVGLVLLTGWLVRTVRLTRRDAQPLVDLRLAISPGVAGPNLVAFLLGLAMYALLTLVVLIVRNDDWGLDRDALSAGLVLVPYALSSVIGSRVALRTSRRFGPRWVLPIGSLVFATSMLLLAFAHDNFLHVLLAMALGGIGSGFTFSSLPMLIVPHVPAAETGSALSFNLLLRYIGFSVGSAASVALLEVLGNDQAALRATIVIMAGVCLSAALVRSTPRTNYTQLTRD